jgi:hypothetical protein
LQKASIDLATATALAEEKGSGKAISAGLEETMKSGRRRDSRNVHVSVLSFRRPRRNEAFTATSDRET